MSTSDFQHQHAAHCESGVIASIFRNEGVQVSEAMAFGLASALSFAYLPFIKLGGLPLIAYRMPPKFIIKGLAKVFKAKFRFETFRDPSKGKARLDELLDKQTLVGLQTSVYWLPYFPPDMRFHFNGHNLLAYGRDGNDYLISDPVCEVTVTCPSDDLQRARFAKGALAPKGLLYYPVSIAKNEITSSDVRRAIVKNCRIMLGPVPIAGIRGMRMLAKKVRALPNDADETKAFIGHIIRMQEEIGTGGAGFRFLYAAFLQEADGILTGKSLAKFAEELLAIGDQWRGFALAIARMVKGRDAVSTEALSEQLLVLAKTEHDFFKRLKMAVS
ncbi:BtrH N-terminal domain-containing protein [Simiduia aestuariiviva]|uniref:Peptidase n=1 Tax=Simiduia aestuariiviva TaxID=1510459 RepID=A0A839USH2_9GAMM|nr:BtrH N-terminal domain-containing protein [Simiduia aestuariiviva]MBB3168337.1 hypothetical protein [Simiduia aestuariiviva]